MKRAQIMYQALQEKIVVRSQSAYRLVVVIKKKSLKSCDLLTICR